MRNALKIMLLAGFAVAASAQVASAQNGGGGGIGDSGLGDAKQRDLPTSEALSQIEGRSNYYESRRAYRPYSYGRRDRYERRRREYDDDQ